MIIAHTGDLHIGKRLHERSLLEEQRVVLWNMLDAIEKRAAEILILAGDIYDKPTPSVEAVKLFDDFLYEVNKRGIKLFAISGNHDSMERISFGSRIMQGGGIYFHENFNKKPEHYVVSDQYGDLNIYMIPFIKPAMMGKDSYEEAFKWVIESAEIDFTKRNILVAHQFFTGTSLGQIVIPGQNMDEGLPIRSESETVNVGGIDNISYELVKGFDYVALGHLHRAQSVGAPHIRYSGSPLKYSFSEANDEKSIEVIDIREKGKLVMEQIPLEMPRELRTIKGRLEHLTSAEVVNDPSVSNEDYIRAIITNEERVTDAANKLLRWYPNLLKIEYQLKSVEDSDTELSDMKGKTPFELFSDYFNVMNNRLMTKEEADIVIEILGGGGNETN